MHPLPVRVWTDKVHVQPFRGRKMRAGCMHVLVSPNEEPEDILFVPSGVDVQAFWLEVIIPFAWQLEAGMSLQVSCC